MLFDNTNFELITSNCTPRLSLTKEALKIINANHFDFIRSLFLISLPLDLSLGLSLDLSLLISLLIFSDVKPKIG